MSAALTKLLKLRHSQYKAWGIHKWPAHDNTFRNQTAAWQHCH